MGILQLKLDFPQDRADTFDNLVPDPGNETAAKLCHRFASGVDAAPLSLALHGPALCGKTHLLSAMGRKAAETVGPQGVIYLDCARLGAGEREEGDFGRVKDYVHAMDRALFLAVDSLEAAQVDEELADLVFHLYNEVTAKPKGRFAAAVSIPPAEWTFPDWLKTRLLWGHVVALRPVGDEARPKVLMKMAAEMRMTLPPEAAEWLVVHLPRDPQSQARVLGRVDRLSLTTGRKVSISLIKEALEQNDGK
jgi:chromosomal replication initiator protein